MPRNAPRHYSFKGRYTLREINDTWYVYDRERGGIARDSPRWNVFTKAERGLIGYITEKIL